MDKYPLKCQDTIMASPGKWWKRAVHFVGLFVCVIISKEPHPYESEAMGFVGA